MDATMAIDKTMLKEEVDLWLQCEELDKHITMQKARDRALTDQLEKSETKKLQLEVDTANLALEKEQLFDKLRIKEQEAEMLGEHMGKMSDYIKMLTAEDPTAEELDGCQSEVEKLKEVMARFADEVRRSAWIPEIQKLRKALEDDAKKLEEEQREVQKLESAVNDVKCRVSLCRENSFIELVVKLVKYKAQREEMMRIYVKAAVEHSKIAKELERQSQEQAFDCGAPSDMISQQPTALKEVERDDAMDCHEATAITSTQSELSTVPSSVIVQERVPDSPRPVQVNVTVAQSPVQMHKETREEQDDDAIINGTAAHKEMPCERTNALMDTSLGTDDLNVSMDLGAFQMDLGGGEGNGMDLDFGGQGDNIAGSNLFGRFFANQDGGDMGLNLSTDFDTGIDLGFNLGAWGQMSGDGLFSLDFGDNDKGGSKKDDKTKQKPGSKK